MKPEIHLLGRDYLTDFIRLLEVFQLTFDHKEPIAEHVHLSKLLSDAQFLVFVVKYKQIVVGGATIYVLNRYFGKKPMAYLYDVGIHPKVQGRGFGKSLMSYICTYCMENEFEDVFVQAEADDTDAIEFYRKTNFGTELQANVFVYDFSERLPENV